MYFLLEKVNFYCHVGLLEGISGEGYGKGRSRLASHDEMFAKNWHNEKIIWTIFHLHDALVVQNVGQQFFCNPHKWPYK